MKTLKYYPILAVFFALSISFYSCSKNESEKESIVTEKVFDKLTNVTDNYVKSNTSSSRKDVIELIYIDVAAGLIAYNSGSSISDAITAGLTASIASYAASSFNPGDIGTDVDFAANEYDYVGKYHVQVLDDIITDESGIYIQDGDLNYEKVLDYSNQFLSANGLDEYSKDFTDLNISVNNSIATLEEAGNLVSNLVPSEGQVHIILKNYLLALESSNSVEAFTDYSKTIEMIIIDSEEFSHDEKEYLLTNMSTSRHDFSYWSS